MSIRRTLLTGIIDYAGLFPPAGLDMAATVQRYATHRSGQHAWMLGRLVVPMGRLDELEQCLEEVSSGSYHLEPWRISVIAAPPYDAAMGRVWEFNRRHGVCAGAEVVIDSVEMKADTENEVELAADAVPAGFELYVEVPLTGAPAGLLAAIARSGAMAKIRTGGITPAQIPAAADLATALAACHHAGAPFKATAGLHYPLRSERPLTYETNPPRAAMHGFLNLLVAAAFVTAASLEAEKVRKVLEDDSPESLVFGSDGVAWRGHRLSVVEIRAARRFFRSFGACSFEEPINGLQRLGLL
jgi:hypothetical protein